jgi:hypothetical protein
MNKLMHKTIVKQYRNKKGDFLFRSIGVLITFIDNEYDYDPYQWRRPQFLNFRRPVCLLAHFTEWEMLLGPRKSAMEQLLV